MGSLDRSKDVGVDNNNDIDREKYMRNLLMALLCAFSSQAMAVSVSSNPLLPDGISLDYAGLDWQSATLSDTERPNGLVGPLGVIHLGTNSDVFRKSSNEYWVRYTLDSTSQFTYEYYPDPAEITPLSGEYWLSFKKVSGGYEVASHIDQIDQIGIVGQFASHRTFDASLYASSNQNTWQSFSTGAQFFLAFTGVGGSSLNLSFLKLEWDFGASKYVLKTSTTGFDQVYYEWASEGAYGTASLNIAPVPLPASAVLLLSGLTTLIGTRRFRKSVI